MLRPYSRLRSRTWPAPRCRRFRYTGWVKGTHRQAARAKRITFTASLESTRSWRRECALRGTGHDSAQSRLFSAQHGKSTGVERPFEPLDPLAHPHQAGPALRNRRAFAATQPVVPIRLLPDLRPASWSRASRSRRAAFEFLHDRGVRTANFQGDTGRGRSGTDPARPGPPHRAKRATKRRAKVCCSWRCRMGPGGRDHCACFQSLVPLFSGAGSSTGGAGGGSSIGGASA